MATGSGSLGTRRRSGRGKWVLFGLLLVYGGGFYSGIYATRRVIAGDSDILHRAFGIPQQTPAKPAPAQPPVAAVPQAAPQPAAPQTTAPQATVQPPAATPQTGASAAAQAPASAAAQPDPNATQPSASTDAEQKPQPTAHGPAAAGSGSDQAQLASMVDDYNDMLHRIQDALRHYNVIHQKTLDSKTRAQDLKQFTDQENNLLNEISRNTKHAENVQDAIRSASNYAELYMDGSNCATRKEIPTRLLDLDIDKLKFIDKAP